MLKKYAKYIHGIIHCSGGGQTKILHYLPDGLKVVKNNLLPIPPIFTLIQESAQTPWNEMYQVFNMGQRMEVYTTPKIAPYLVELAQQVGIDATISGYVAEGIGKEVIIETDKGVFKYQ
jgi:phosphoribosylformylglycinamidine cyclo-ligase